MHAFVIIASLNGEPVDPELLARIDHGDLPELAFQPDEAVDWRNRRQSFLYAGQPIAIRTARSYEGDTRSLYVTLTLSFRVEDTTFVNLHTRRRIVDSHSSYGQTAARQFGHQHHDLNERPTSANRGILRFQPLAGSL
jgi:hypothetical protein